MPVQTNDAAAVRARRRVAELVRLRWAVRGVLAFGLAASIAANVLHAPPNLTSQVISAWPPLSLLLTLELVSRIPVHRWWRAAIRVLATTTVAGIAAWVSYWHMAEGARRFGETGVTPYLLPISVDGLIVVASICLIELTGRIREAGKTQPAANSPTATDDTAPVTRRPRQPRRNKSTLPPKRSDEHLLAQLADLPRDRDGKVAVRRAAAALGTGPDRARRLLTQAGLRRVSDEDSPTSTATAPPPVPVPRTDHHQEG
jgi:hypothetical protein